MFGTADRDIHHATVDEFQLMRARGLAGPRLDAVKHLQTSILRFGLLSPITVLKRAGRLVVVDGRKRLAAIRRLAFEGRLPRSLNRIPYRLAKSAMAASQDAPALMYNRDLYEAISDQFRSGMSLDDITKTVHLSRQCVHDMLSLTRLSPIIREAFFKKMINPAQAKAYAAIPDRAEQVARLRQVGLFAAHEAILARGRAEEDRAIAA